VSRALDRIKDAGDRVAFIVVVAALDQTQRLGHRPSNRQLAESLGVSHTAVNKALARFRQLLESESTPR
jgi:DNA-binding GntR family transcriptional regulator